MATPSPAGRHASPVPNLEPLEEDRSHQPTRTDSILTSLGTSKPVKYSRWRHTLGIALLMVTVFLWTTSNFLASTIFADDTYSKPYFVTFTNSAFFILPLLPMLAFQYREDPSQFEELWDLLRSPRSWGYSPLGQGDGNSTDPEASPLFNSSGEPSEERNERHPHPPSPSSSPPQSLLHQPPNAPPAPSERLRLAATFRLSLSFCLLWFAANYFAASCLEYTTVASATILTSTSSVWTLLVGTWAGVEKFTFRKLGGVVCSLAGIVLISTVDVSGQTNKNRGSFPSKTAGEIAVGDTLAFVSAVAYGFYAVVLKKKVGDESRVNMPIFFGLVGLLNVLLLWPVFLILHWTGIERFELPPDGRVVLIIIVNSISSLFSDMCWAFAMLLTSPLVVTVGLSMTIPLSLVGQMVLDSQYSSATYWVGACIVVLSFIFINHEEKRDEEEQSETGTA